MSSESSHFAHRVRVASPSSAYNTTPTPSSGALPFMAGSVVLGTIGVFVHEAGVHAVTATWFRCAFGLLGLSVWLLLRQQWQHLSAPRAAMAWIVASGSLMVLAWCLFFAAIERTSAGVATMLFHLQPLWVLLLGRLLLKEHIVRHRLGAVLLAMAGLLLATGVLQHMDADSARGSAYWWGVGMCLLGALCTAGVAVIARHLRALPSGALAWWQCLIGTLALLAWPVVHGWPALGISWLWLSGLGLLHTALAYSLLYAGMARLPTDRIAVLQFVYPAIVLLIDWLVYGEQLGTAQLLGIALMGLAIWWAERPAPSCTPTAT